MTDGRRCVVCGAQLEGRRRHARACSGRCRAEASRVHRLFHGRAAGSVESLRAYAARVSASKAHPGSDKPAGATISGRSRAAFAYEFVDCCVRPAAGELLDAGTAFDTYRRWLTSRPGGGEVVSYASFLRVLDSRAPFQERRIVRTPGKPGRGRLNYVNVALRNLV